VKKRESGVKILSVASMVKFLAKKKKPAKGPNPKPRKRPRAILSTIGKMLFGVFLGLFVVQWFVPMLPGPKVEATVDGKWSNDYPGCIYYNLRVGSDEFVEYIYLKIQVPGKINNSNIGLSHQSYFQGRMISLQPFQYGVDATGKCIIFINASPLPKNASVQVSTDGDMIEIRASKSPAQTVIVGMIATTQDHTNSSDFYTEGAYEYRKLGQTVRKPLFISYTGIKEEKATDATKGQEQGTP
jgi:hypothetical protein